MLELVPAQLTHIGPLARRIREIDLLECKVMGHSAKQALRSGLLHSTLCWTALLDGRPEAMLGVMTSSLLDREGVIWMLVSDEGAKQHRALVRLPAVVLPAIHKHYDILHNRVHSSNRRAIRWLEHLGFEIGPEEQVRGEPMRTFKRCADQQYYRP